jgi:hypothetical protein
MILFHEIFHKDFERKLRGIFLNKDKQSMIHLDFEIKSQKKKIRFLFTDIRQTELESIFYSIGKQIDLLTYLIINQLKLK